MYIVAASAEVRVKTTFGEVVVVAAPPLIAIVAVGGTVSFTNERGGFDRRISGFVRQIRFEGDGSVGDRGHIDRRRPGIRRAHRAGRGLTPLIITSPPFSEHAPESVNAARLARLMKEPAAGFEAES